MSESLGLHKIGNPGDEEAVTLHLYSPPYNSCRIWLDPSDAHSDKDVSITYFSVDGEVTDY